jgi:hypothetical protein
VDGVAAVEDRRVGRLAASRLAARAVAVGARALAVSGGGIALGT